MSADYVPREEPTRTGYGCMYCHGWVNLLGLDLSPKEGYCTGCGRTLDEFGMYLKQFVPGGMIEGEFPTCQVTVHVKEKEESK